MGAHSEATIIEAFGVRLGVRSDVYGALGQVAARLPADWALAPAGDSRLEGVSFDALLALRESGDEFVVTLDGEEMGRAENSDGAIDLLVPEIQLYFAEHARTNVLVHAGAVGWRGSAIIIPGRSLTGKSTLVAALVRAGASYYSDEFAVLDPDGCLRPFARPLALRRPDRSDEGRFAPEALGGATGTLPLRIGLILLAPYRSGARWSPREASAAEGVAALLRNSLVMRRRPESALSVLARVGREAACWAGERGDTAEVLRWLHSIARFQACV